MKQQRAFKKIDRKIYIVFFVVIAIAIINAVISTYTIRNSHSITSELVNNTNPSLNSLARFNLLVTRSRMLATNWVYLPNNQADKDSLRALNNQTYIELRGRMKGLMSHWKDSQDKAKMDQLFTEYDELTAYHAQIMRLLITFDDYQDPTKRFAAEEILEREILPRSEHITEALKDIMTKRSEMASQQQDRMLYSFNTLMVLVLGIALLIICSILFAAFVISRTIILPVLTVRSIIMQMGRGELPELRMKFPKNAVGEMMQALRFMVDGFRQTSTFVEEIGKGNLQHPYKPLSANDVQGHALLRMRNQLKEAYEVEARRAWLAEGLAELNEIMRSNQDDFNKLLDNIVDNIVDRIGVQQAAIFLLHNDDMNDLHIQLGAYFALNHKILNSRRYELKEGLIGQAIASNKIIALDEVNDPYFTIDTGIGESKSCSIIIIPLVTSGKVVGAIEVASMKPFDSAQREMLEKMAEPVAASLFSLRANLITSQLLEESRKQADELAYQEQELRKINDELTKQSQLLRQSEEELKSQQEELKQMNIELQEKAQLLQEQNIEIEDARQSLVFKAAQLEQSNKYKSSFLANMSHELRTPLNSILILAKLLSNNKNKSLSEKEIEHANIIHKSGSDLLNLINDILDLSKIEAGKVEYQNERFNLKLLADDIHLLFREYAHEKKINFKVSLSDTELFVHTDKMRLEQVVKNLLSNAFKFTPENGTVELLAGYAPADAIFKEKSLLQSDRVISISVKDSGIGIPEDKQKQVFEAFQQADGSTSRRFGGTGLGLAICKELVHMMGGEIALESIEHAGSTFTVYLPGEGIPVTEEKTGGTVQTEENGVSESKAELYNNDEIRDDRNHIGANDKTILIVEDDYVFARLLMNQCHRFSYKAVIALQGDQGLSYARHYRPHAIILDLRLPVMDGWTVLKKLKEDKSLRNIPVHIISSLDKRQLGMELGAASYLNKPAGKQEMEELFRVIDPGHDAVKKILLLSDNNEEIRKVLEKLRQKEKEIEISNALSIDECAELARNHHYTGFILGSGKNNEAWLRTARGMESLRNIPTVVVEHDSDQVLDELHAIITHDPLKERAQVLDAAESFLHHVEKGETHYAEVKDKMENMLKGKTVLLVDDDMRNIYSLTNILEQEGIQVLCAYDGRQALEQLKANKQVDLVLMDIMMPNMNGYEATQEIRKNPDWELLPVIAVTAKAMNGDREKCMESGASDYLTKPVNIDQLISLMKVWMYK
ncbi:MAG: response regulator [Bacteroidia bacterium]|nr:response regulator [Bacteroidia bacterium]